jgi:hypothetical protein
MRIVQTDWMRIHKTRYSAIYFDRSTLGRFNAPSNEFGILYLALDAHGAFVEMLGRQTGIKIVEWSELACRSLSHVSTSRPLSLVDLTGVGLAQLGADSRLTSDTDYSVPHQWALVMHKHPQLPDGILYRARHDPERQCAAIFGRAEDAFSESSLGSLADAQNAVLLGDILDTYRYGLINSVAP